jgi:hypothetical protein
VRPRKIRFTDSAAEEDPVHRQQIFVFLHAGRVDFQEVPHPLDPVRGQILVQPADAHRVVGQTGAAEFLEQVEQDLPFAECVEEHRHGAEVEGMRAEPHQVGGDALQLRQNHPDVLRARRHLDVQETLHGAAVAEVLGNRRDVVEPVGQRLDHRVGAMLAELLDTAVQVADDRPHLGDLLTVQLQQKTEHPVGRGVLRPHVDFHLLGAEHQPFPAPVLSTCFFQPKPRSGALSKR